MFISVDVNDSKMLRERSFLGGEIFTENMILCPSRVLFLSACFMVRHR
jgi:hypothetical protein